MVRSFLSNILFLTYFFLEYIHVCICRCVCTLHIWAISCGYIFMCIFVCMNIHVYVGTHTCVCAYSCMCACAYACEYVCAGKLEANIAVFNSWLLCVLRQGFSLEFRARQFVSLANQLALGNPLSLLPMGWAPRVYIGAADPNSGPHTYLTNTLPLERLSKPTVKPYPRNAKC